MCVCLCVCFPCSCKSPDWHVDSVGKQQVWDTLMAFTDGFRTLPMGGLLLHLLIYSFSTAEETLRPMWLFPRAKVPWEQLGCFLIQSLLPPSFFPLASSVPLPSFHQVGVCVCMCVCVCGRALCGSNLITPVQQASWQALNVIVAVSLYHWVSVGRGTAQRRGKGHHLSVTLLLSHFATSCVSRWTAELSDSYEVKSHRRETSCSELVEAVEFVSAPF